MATTSTDENFIIASLGNTTTVLCSYKRLYLGSLCLVKRTSAPNPTTIAIFIAWEGKWNSQSVLIFISFKRLHHQQTVHGYKWWNVMTNNCYGKLFLWKLDLYELKEHNLTCFTDPVKTLSAQLSGFLFLRFSESLSLSFISSDPTACWNQQKNDMIW